MILSVLLRTTDKSPYHSEKPPLMLCCGGPVLRARVALPDSLAICRHVGIGGALRAEGILLSRQLDPSLGRDTPPQGGREDAVQGLVCAGRPTGGRRFAEPGARGCVLGQGDG